MAYAELAGLPAITGLYTSILCLLGYAVFGPSRILVLGPDSSLGPMIAATLAPLLLADGSPDRAIALASALALIVGAVTILAGAFHLGFVADLLSKPTQIGYMNGLALTILVGQLPKLFGFSVDADDLIDEATGFVRGVSQGEIVGVAALIGLASLALILVLQRTMPKVPAVLIAVVPRDRGGRGLRSGGPGVAVVGSLPQGFPPLTIPDVSLTDIGHLLPGALGIALVALVDTISTASAFAERAGDRIRGEPGDGRDRIGERRRGPVPGIPGLDQRLAHGRRGAGGGQDPGGRPRRRDRDHPDPPAGTRPPAEPAAADAGRRGHRGVAVPGRHPRCRAPVETATGRMRPGDRGVPGRRLLGVLPGIAVAVALSIYNVFRRSWWPYQATLGRVDGLPGLHDTAVHPEAALMPDSSSSGSMPR
jgi:MFS superfamily sulfate permease-like transporter